MRQDYKYSILEAEEDLSILKVVGMIITAIGCLGLLWTGCVIMLCL